MIAELRTLIAVARHGTFAAAGERLGLTQAGVSGHVRRLEDALGFQLFERTGRSARLNAAGARTLGRAEDLVAAFDALGAPEQDVVPGRSLRIGAIASVQATIVARALVSYRSRQPDCRFHLTPGISLHLVDRVDAGELDLAVAIRPLLDLPPHLGWVDLVAEEYAMLVPAGEERRDWRQIISRQPFIRYDRSSFGGRQVDRFLRRKGVAVDHWLEADDLHAMVALVAGAAGCAIVPMTEALGRMPSNIRKLALGPDAPSRLIGVVHQAPHADPAADGLIRCLVEAAVFTPSR